MKEYFFNWKQSYTVLDEYTVLEVTPCSFDGDEGISRLYVPELHLWFSSWADLDMYLSFQRNL